VSAEFWIGFFYGGLAVALPVCAVVTWRANKRVQQWLAREQEINHA
jgi:hypothetical protein